MGEAHLAITAKILWKQTAFKGNMDLWTGLSMHTPYSFSHNHGSGQWLYLQGNYYWGGPIFNLHDCGRKDNLHRTLHIDAHKKDRISCICVRIVYVNIWYLNSSRRLDHLFYLLVPKLTSYQESLPAKECSNKTLSLDQSNPT